MSRSARARGGAASLRGCAVRLRPHGRGSFPFEQQRFCALAKTLDASCAHQEGVLRPNARGTRPSLRAPTCDARMEPLWLAAGAASRWNVAVGALLTYLFPLNNSVLPPPAKLLMRLARIKRACYVRPAAAHVRRRIKHSACIQRLRGVQTMGAGSAVACQLFIVIRIILTKFMLNHKILSS